LPVAQTAPEAIFCRLKEFLLFGNSVYYITERFSEQKSKLSKTASYLRDKRHFWTIKTVLNDQMSFSELP
jgi:hypothetical protein